MKRILLLIIFISLNVCTFAQRTNIRAEYLVKSIHFINPLTQKDVGNKGDKWYYFKYDNNGKLIEIRHLYYESFKYKTTDIYTITNKRYQFISYVNGKQVINYKCQFTFNKEGLINKFYTYKTKGDRWTETYTLTYNSNYELTSINSVFQELGGHNYKYCEYEEPVWSNGNVISNFDPVELKKSGLRHGETFEYGDVENNTNINLPMWVKHGSSPYNSKILFVTEWCGAHNKKMIKDGDDFKYYYKNDLIYKIVKTDNSVLFGTYMIEYEY